MLSTDLQAAPALPPLPIKPSRAHLSRLMKIWRSGGWPCQDALEIDLLAAGWVQWSPISDAGSPTLRLTELGIQLLAAARQGNQRALSRHDQLAQRMGQQLISHGRVVWRELSLRAQVQPDGAALPAALPTSLPPSNPANGEFFQDSDLATDTPPEHLPASGKVAKIQWRIARPDLFSVRNTTVENYLQPVVHEIKVSRADLLSDLRHAAKRESYQWLCCECYYVFPAGLAEPQEIPAAFGLWVLHGDIATGRLELLRPARHAPCELPFAVWLALAKATPLRSNADPEQTLLGAPGLAEPAPTDDTAAGDSAA
jgi:hypothetical protein